jgi:hypothetical protein
MAEQDKIQYQGQYFKLITSYNEYDQFKNDPDNVDRSENARMQRAVVGAPIARSHPTSEAMISAVYALKFPGRALGHFPERPQPDGTVLSGWSVEIPRAGKWRILVFRGVAGEYTLIDDFVAADDPLITAVNEQDGHLVFSDLHGKRVLTRQLSDRGSR